MTRDRIPEEEDKDEPNEGLDSENMEFYQDAEDSEDHELGRVDIAGDDS